MAGSLHFELLRRQGALDDENRAKKDFDRDFELRQEVIKIVNSLGLVGENQLLEETELAQNRIRLAPGEGKPFTIDHDQTEVLGMGTRIPCQIRCVMTRSARIVGVTFLTHPALTTTPVYVNGPAGTRVLFDRCWFLHAAGHAEVSMVEVSSTSQAIFNSCVFIRGGGSTTNAILNGAGIADVRVNGSNRVGFTSYGTVTVTGSLP